MMHFEDDFEPPRPAFVATVKQKRPNPVTGIIEPYIPRRVRTGRYMVATVAITMMILLVLASLFGVVVYRAIVIAVMAASPSKNLQGSGRIYTSLTSALLNLLSINVLGKVKTFSLFFFFLSCPLLSCLILFCLPIPSLPFSSLVSFYGHFYA